MSDIKIGIIGTNFVSDWFCEAAETVDGIASHAVYSRTCEHGEKFAERHGITNVTCNMDEFLSSDIDAVYIASPNVLHFPQAKAAMEHGKHVLVEKPAALDRKQFSELTRIAEENNVVLLEAIRPVHDPALAIVRELIEKIGTVRRAVFEFCQYSSRYDRYKSGEILNAFTPALGNAALMDIGVYAVECCTALFGSPKSVCSRSVILENGMEGMGSALLDYGEMQAEIVYSKITDSCNPSAITGEDGSIIIGKLSTLESVGLRMRGSDEKTVVSGRAENNMVYEIGNFLSAIKNERNVSQYTENTLASLSIMDEIRRQNGIIFE